MPIELTPEQIAEVQVLASSSLRLIDCLRILKVSRDSLDSVSKLPAVIDAFEQGRLHCVREVTRATVREAIAGNASSAKLLLGRADSLSKPQEAIAKARFQETWRGLSPYKEPNVIKSVDDAMARSKALMDAADARERDGESR